MVSDQELLEEIERQSRALARIETGPGAATMAAAAKAVHLRELQTQAATRGLQV